MTVRHIFLWSVKEGHDGDSVLKKLAALETEVPGLLGWSIGKHEGENPNSSTGKWQYGLTCDVESWEALDAYQNHPTHNAIVQDVLDSYDDWLVVDYALD
ncbi:Dabb family protein (plasmid) [Rhodococcus opacus]|uniref:Dabb family protein n=1 Tax=Rhodococcus opacus TaxID=37919 RepID=UPI0034D25CDD